MEYKSGQLHWNKKILIDFVKNYENPVYVYNLDEIRQQIKTLKSNLPKDVSVHYAMKANSHPDILAEFVKAGFGMDVVSGGEISKAIAVKCQGKDIVFSGVAKSKKEIDEAIEAEVGIFNVESLQELERVADRAQDKNKKVGVGVRVNPDVTAETHPHIHTGGAADKFGIPFDQMGRVFEILNARKESLLFKGFSLHVGSQLMEFSPIEKAFEKVWPVFAAHQKTTGFDCIDIGGGLGYDYQNGRGIELSAYSSLLKAIQEKSNCHIMIEPGRWLVAKSGVLLTRVEYIKISGDKRWVIVDTGMNHFMRPALYSAKHRILPLKESKSKTARWDVVGPICESTDVLATNIELPENIHEGDFLAILDTGAYGFELANSYNSRPFPSQLVFNSHQAAL